MPNFTKAPWTVCNTNQHLVYSTVNNKAVALAIGPVDEEQKANARLIASAPEMFRLLKSVVDGSAFLFDDNGHRIFLEDTARVFKNLLAYIEGKN